MTDTALCRDCKTLLPLSEFTKNVRMSNGYQSRCRECYNAVQRIRQRAYQPRRRPKKKQYPHDPNIARQSALRTKYGITLKEYEAMLRGQSGVCHICREPESVIGNGGRLRSLTVDHDHACCPGKKACGNCIRGLLCSRCNSGLGLFRDSPEVLMSAIAYLNRPAQA